MSENKICIKKSASVYWECKSLPMSVISVIYTYCSLYFKSMYAFDLGTVMHFACSHTKRDLALAVDLNTYYSCNFTFSKRVEN